MRHMRFVHGKTLCHRLRHLQDIKLTLCFLICRQDQSKNSRSHRSTAGPNFLKPCTAVEVCFACILISAQLHSVSNNLNDLLFLMKRHYRTPVWLSFDQVDWLIRYDEYLIAQLYRFQWLDWCTCGKCSSQEHISSFCTLSRADHL